MEIRAAAWSKSVQHDMNSADLNHGRTGFGLSFIIFTVSAVAAVPCVCPFHHPAFLEWRKSLRSFRTRLHFDVPGRSVRRHPGLKMVIMILAIAKDGRKAWKGFGRDFFEPLWGGDSIIHARARDQDGHQQPQRIDQQMPLASL